MRHLLSLSLLLATLAIPAFGQRNIGGVDVTVDSKTVAIRVAVSGGGADLASLARRAFGSNGRYKVVDSGFAWDVKLVAIGASQVRADIVNQAGATVASQAFSGTTIYNALLKAADFAVERTNGLGLKGFFASRIAFVGQASGKTEIYTADLFFTPGSVRQETMDRAQILTPRWSPDGRKIVYTSYLKGVPDIYQITLGSPGRDVMMSVQGTNMAGPFSPDGRQIVSILTGTGRPEVWVVDAQTHAPRKLTNSDTVKSSPTWSPDGSQIVFAMSPGPHLYVMSSAGGAPRQLATGTSYASEPSWSRANPNKIAFTVNQGSSDYISVLDLSTNTARRVSPNGFYTMQPAWLADGRHLLVTVQSGSRSRLYILDTEGNADTPTFTAVSVSQVEPASQGSVWTP